MRNVIILALLACLAFPLTSKAQLFVSAGVSFPISPDGVSDFYSSGFGATAGFALDLPLIPVTPRAWINYDSFPIDEDAVPFDVDGGNLRAITVAADVQFTAPMGPLSPYIAPAVGLTFISLDDIESGGVQVSDSDSETASTVGIGGGLALDLLIGPQLFLDGKLLYAFTEGDNLLWMPIRLGIVLGL